MLKVLFVCLGNICRSPLAEAYFQKLINEKGLQDKMMTDSCGIGKWHEGELADAQMRKCALGHNIEITHRSRQIKPSDLINFDYAIALDTSVRNDVDKIRASRPNSKAQIILLRNFDPQHPDKDDVPDPYQKSDEHFETAYEIVTRSCDALFQKICKDHNL